MSEASPSTTQSSLPGGGSPRSGRTTSLILRTVLYGSLVGAFGIVAYSQFRAAEEKAGLHEAQKRLVEQHGLLQPARKRLAPEYSDKDGGLLADPPSDPANLLDPNTLVVAYYKDADVETQPVDWEGFHAHLAKATGKQVVGREYLNSADEVDAIKAGQIQVVALHAADTPYLVNNAGFIPVAVLGTEAAAHGNHLDVAVAAKGDIKTLSDIRGRTLTCTVPDSITGYRAAIAVLWQETGMRPDVDYFIHFSHGQKRSVLGVAAGDFEVAALSDDKVRSMLKKGTVDASDYRVIHESQVIPRLTIGYVYNLKPELATQVASAASDFANEGGATEESTGNPMRFLAIDYKKDFEFVRRMDDSFDPRVHKRPREKPASAPIAQ